MSWNGDSKRHRLALQGVSTGRRSNQMSFFQSHGFSQTWIQKNYLPTSYPTRRSYAPPTGWRGNPFRHSLSARGIQSGRSVYVSSYTRRPTTYTQGYQRLPTKKYSLDITDNSRVSVGLRNGLPYGQAQYDLSEKTTATYEANLTEGQKMEITHQPTKNTEISVGITTNTGPYVEASAKIGPVQVGAQINKEGKINATIKPSNQ